MDYLADVLARAVDGQWTRAAADRGLLVPEPIPVRWRRPSVPLAGPGGGRGGRAGVRPAARDDLSDRGAAGQG